MEMDKLLIWSFVILCIVSAIYWFLIRKKSTITQNQSQAGNQPSVSQTNRNSWMTGLQVFAGIMGVVLLIWFLSWYFNGITNYHLEEGKVYSVEIPFPKKFSVYGHGKKFYASIDGNNWRLVGGGLPRNDWGQRVNIYYFKYFEPETEVTIRLYR